MAKRRALRHALEFCAVWPLLKLLEWLPLPLARGVAGGVSRALYALTPRWRSAAWGNLELALPELTPSQRQRVIRGVYGNLGRVLLSIARMPRLSASNIGEWIEYEGLEHFQSARRRGRGVLFMTAHLGNWELSAFAHALFGHPMHVMVRPLDNPWLDRLVQRYRRLSGNQTISKHDAGRKVLRALRDNQAVGILIDQNTAGEDAVFVDFFGHPASATRSFVRLARSSGAAVIPGFALWRPDTGRYCLRFYPPLELADPPEDEDGVADTQLCQRFIETVIREHPDQWLWIHRRWKNQPAGSTARVAAS
jgi:KDO2-lipid IV(A) lauroyltransferase